MNTMNYLAFLKVCETSSITKAAKELGYSQPGVSHMLDALETELEIKLLIRRRNSIQPTDEGKHLIPMFQKLLKAEDDIRNFARSMKAMSTDCIKIGALTSLIVNFAPQIISKYSSVYSDISITLQENSHPHIIEMLHTGEIDLGFTCEFHEKGLQFIPLFDDPICLVMSNRHPFTSYDTIPLNALDGCDFIMPMDEGDGHLHLAMKLENVKPRIKQYAASDTAGISMAANNLGVWMAPKMQLRNLPDNVVAREFSPNIYRTLGIGLRTSSNSLSSIKKFIQMTQSLSLDAAFTS